MIRIADKDGVEVKVGSEVVAFDGERASFVGVSREVGASGLLIDVMTSCGVQAMYPDVFGLVIVENVPRNDAPPRNRAERRALRFGVRS